MTLPPFGWKNGPNTSTRLSASELEAFGAYIAAYFEDGDSAFGDPTAVVTASSPGGINPLPGTLPAANILDQQWGGTKADAILVTDAAMTSGSNGLSSAQAAFTSADVNKYVIVQGAGALIGSTAQGPLAGYIGSVTAGVASLVTTSGGSTPANATTTVSNVQAAYGTAGLGAAIQTAARAGYRVHIPAGAFMWDTPVLPSGSTTTQSLHIEGDSRGHRTTIYYNNLQTNLSWTGPGLQGSVGTLSSNAIAGDQYLNLNSVPAGLAAGDYVFLSSTDVFDSVEGATHCGEICRVQGISGTQLALFSAVCGPNSYLTASTAQVQKITFCDGVTIQHLTMVNPAQEKYTLEGFASGLTPVYAAGFTNGIFQIRGCRNVAARYLRFDGWSGIALQMAGCIDWHVDDVHFRNGARGSSSGTPGYGYGVTSYGSQWGKVVHCSAENIHSLFDANGSGSVPTPVDMPSHLVEVRGCTAYGAGAGMFVCHNPSSHIDLIDCRTLGGPQQAPDTSHQQSFQIVGHYCKVINPVAVNVAGVGVNLQGNHCEVIDAIIRNVKPNQDSGIGIQVAVGTATPPGAVTAGGNRVINADIDGVAKSAAGTQGYGILLQSTAVATEILRSAIRNTQADGIDIGAAGLDDCVIDDVLFEGIGLDGSTHYCINTAVVSPSANWRNLRTRALGAGTTLTNKASGVISAYQLITGSSTVPALSSHPRVRAGGGGGGGGGAGSAAAAQLQVGGGGGSGGQIVDVVPSLVGNSIVITIGAAGAHGSGGTLGGNPGTAGGTGGTTNVADSGASTVAKARGGTGGAASAASSTTNVGGGLWGGAGTATGTGNTGPAGSGAGSGGTTPYPMLCVVGGSGGAPATATLGGNGGNAQLSSAFLDQVTVGSGNAGTSAGGVGVTATQPGCGGGGGGGGAAGTGAGGNGGDGAAGFVEVWW